MTVTNVYLYQIVGNLCQMFIYLMLSLGHEHRDSANSQNYINTALKTLRLVITPLLTKHPPCKVLVRNYVTVSRLSKEL